MYITLTTYDPQKFHRPILFGKMFSPNMPIYLADMLKKFSSRKMNLTPACSTVCPIGQNPGVPGLSLKLFGKNARSIRLKKLASEVCLRKLV